MKQALYLLSICVCLQASAQSSLGQWKATAYPQQAVLLEWNHAAMLQQEKMGDAIVALPIAKPKALQQQQQSLALSNNKSALISNHAGSLQLQMGNLKIDILAAFDSGHIRGFRIAMPDSMQWYGGGERTLPMNRRGQRIPLYNNAHYGYELNADELNYSVPFILSLNGYALLFNNPAKGYMDFGKKTPGVLEVAFESGNLNMLIIPGNTAEQLLERYAQLTGKQPLPPRWALGNFVSRFGYRSQQQVQDVVAKMKADNFPMDALVIDIFWFGDSIKGTLGNLDWMNRSKWPTPDSLLQSLRRQNIHPILVTEPFFLKGTKQYANSQPHLATTKSGEPYMLTKFYFGYGGLLDLFTPTARQWFWQFYKQQTDKGVAGWWGDLGEPENHPEDLYHNLQSFGINRKVSANEVHNIYGHMWSKMLYENWRKQYPEQRLFFLNRAGYAGSQRYSIFPWTGDVSRSWGGFQAQLPNLQSMSLSGIPYIHSDAGGFSNTPENDQELYVRWVQMAAFSPIFRPHGTAFGDLEAGVNDLPSEPTFKDEPYKSIARNYIRLRYQLHPYLYTLAWEASTKGKPFIRPMFFSNHNDTVLMQANQQYMFGPSFLVAPVTEKNKTTQRVYLPEGHWYNFYTNEIQHGKQWIEAAAPLQQMPLFVKAGSVIPMWKGSDAAQSLMDYNPKTQLDLTVYPGTTNNSGYIYDDDGKDPSALHNKQAHQLIQWTYYYSNNSISVELKATNWPVDNSRKLRLRFPTKTNLPFALLQAKCTMKGETIYFPTNATETGWFQVPVTFTGKPIVISFIKQ